MNVPLLDLKAQYRGIKSEILAVIEAVCDEQGFVLGPRLAEFEKATAHYIAAMRLAVRPEAMPCSGLDGVGCEGGR